MPQSLSQIWLHVLFSTKNRQPFLQNAGFRTEVLRVISQFVQEIDCVPKCTGGGIDHVHLVCALSPTVTIEKLIEHVKAKTAAWAKKTPNSVATLAWQSSYGVFSVSQSNLERVMDYVMRQEEHHKRKSFQDEFRELCQKHGIAIDEQRVWE